MTQLNLFGSEVKQVLAEAKKPKWIFEDLGIEGETDYITYISNETDEVGWAKFETKKLIKGFRKTKGKESKLVAIVYYIRKDLEGICSDYEEAVNSEDEIRDFIGSVVDTSTFARGKNKRGIFFDTQRYFWKEKDNGEFQKLGWASIDENVENLTIDEDFIMRDDLKEFIFVEDSKGERYRERIMEKIMEMGVVNWFKAKNLPTDENSVWVNRYTGCKRELKELLGMTDGPKYYGDSRSATKTLESEGYFIWENWKPLKEEGK